MTDHIESLGQRIKSLRKQLKFSQDELGEMIGLNRSTINNIERGNQRPSIEFIMHLSEISGETTDTILYGTEPEEIKRGHGLVSAIVKERDAEARQLLADKIEREMIELRKEISSLQQSNKQKDLEMTELKEQLNSISEMIRNLSNHKT